MNPKLLLFLIALAPLLFSQCSDVDLKIIECWVDVNGTYEYISITKAPEYIDGGDEGFSMAVLEEIMYPAEARENGIEGTVIVEYVITQDGTVENIVVIEDIGGGCGEETIRAIEVATEGVSFEPAEIEGQPVRVKKELPVVFKIE